MVLLELVVQANKPLVVIAKTSVSTRWRCLS